jgi:TolA-binding protein
MSMAQDKPELDKGLDEIRREVIESRNLVIKTDNLLKNLHAELKMVGKRQEDFQKRTWISSGVAYGVFAGLCVAGALAFSSVRTSSAGADRERLEKQVAELQAQLDKQKGELNANATAQRQAGEVYRMMTNLQGDERLKGIDALVKLDTQRLSVLEKQALNDRAEILRKEIGGNAFERGKTAFRRNEYGNAVEELSRFMAMNPGQEEALDASFFLGASLTQTRKHEAAIPYLARFIKEDKRSKTRDYAMLLLAQAYDQTSQFEKAAEVARDALATYPNSEFTPQLKGRLSAAKRGMAGADGGQGGAGVVPPGGGAAAPAVAQPPPRQPLQPAAPQQASGAPAQPSGGR